MQKSTTHNFDVEQCNLSEPNILLRFSKYMLIFDENQRHNHFRYGCIHNICDNRYISTQPKMHNKYKKRVNTKHHKIINYILL